MSAPILYRKSSMFKPDYADSVISLLGRSSIIGYWTLGEPSGSIAYDISGRNHHGVHTAVTLGQAGIGDGRSSGLYNGTTSFTNIYGAGLAARFNGAEGTLLAPVLVNTLGTSAWFIAFGVDVNNEVVLRRASGNVFSHVYIADGTNISMDSSPTVAIATWYHTALTWSKSADQLKQYHNGVQTGATKTGLGVFAGSLSSAIAVIGAGDIYLGLPLNGRLAHALLCNVALPAATIKELYRLAAF